MESNGKCDRSRRAAGRRQHRADPLGRARAPTASTPSTSSSHQGTQLVPCGFPCSGPAATNPLGDHHPILLANCLAQTEALMRRQDRGARPAPSWKRRDCSGEALEQLLPHKVFPGNRPSTSLVLPSARRRSALGSLIALYEHKVFTQGVIWSINSFDQWGVELGKQLANAILPELKGTRPAAGHDASTLGLIGFCREED
ncbi:MAG: hypothetical protein MZV65_30605 [Chromatiales bacterium]|nr:hypothetical protein [Chromatiales bacterium]